MHAINKNIIVIKSTHGQNSVSMVASDWQAPLTTIKEELRCVLITHGEQFVQTTGTLMMPLLPVASLDIVALV